MATEASGVGSNNYQPVVSLTTPIPAFVTNAATYSNYYYKAPAYLPDITDLSGNPIDKNDPILNRSSYIRGALLYTPAYQWALTLQNFDYSQNTFAGGDCSGTLVAANLPQHTHNFPVPGATAQSGSGGWRAGDPNINNGDYTYAAMKDALGNLIPTTPNSFTIQPTYTGTNMLCKITYNTPSTAKAGYVPIVKNYNDCFYVSPPALYNPSKSGFNGYIARIKPGNYLPKDLVPAFYAAIDAVFTASGSFSTDFAMLQSGMWSGTIGPTAGAVDKWFITFTQFGILFENITHTVAEDISCRCALTLGFLPGTDLQIGGGAGIAVSTGQGLLSAPWVYWAGGSVDAGTINPANYPTRNFGAHV